MQVDRVKRLDAGQLSAVLALVQRAKAVDRVDPLSEQVLLAARNGSANGSPNLLAYDGMHLAGYAHLEHGLGGEAATAEVVVDPADRRRGVGTALIRALEDAVSPDAEALQVWSHGHLAGARALAAREHMADVRELWAMRRSLRPDAGSLPDVALPGGFGARSFIVGQDEDAWLRVNARAFADHPEQGRMTRHDLDLRIAEPWFEATGLILIEDTRGVAPVLAASHWTKIVPAARAEVRPTEGEVYVVGVDPAYQGLGLGRAVTILGLAHLRERGMTGVMLYVDADNIAAVATYSRLGFTRFAVDVMYSHAVHPPVSI